MARGSAQDGFSGAETAQIVGITYRQLDYWARTDLVRPSLEDAKGSGSRRRYSYHDLLELKVIKNLLDAGIRLESVRDVFTYLREHLGEDVTRANLVIQGNTSVVIQNDGELIDLVKRGQGVLNILPLAGVKDDLDASIHELQPQGEGADGHPVGKRRVTTLAALPHEAVEFAHNSERQFAKLLDFYGIEWEYEPHTFVLDRDPRGNPLEAFSPDFYLPAYDLHIEITTLKQKLVTKKNRKVRKLQEQYPDTDVTILYQRDYLNLLVKYGLESPEQLAGYADDVATSAEQGDSLLALGIFERPSAN